MRVFKDVGTVAAIVAAGVTKYKVMSEEIKRHQEEERQLRRLSIWSWYMKGARDMLLRMRDHCLCDEPKPKGWSKNKDERIYNKAILDLILYNQDATDRFLSQDYDEIRFTDHEHDKKGKLIKCRAYFAKRVVRIEEIKA